jgi:para-nitrobenzyl esterase
LNLNEITHERIPSTGNEGLLDQIAALEWIKENISVFGGDPGNVTLFGESAGAMGIACLMAMPKARGLFHKVISQSGAANRAKPLSQAVQDAQMFLNCLGQQNPEPQTLRSLTVQQLLSIQQNMESKIQAMTIATPVIDGVVLSDSPINAIKAGYSAGAPLLLGTNLDEWRLFNPNTPNFQKMDSADLVKRCSNLVPSSRVDSLIEVYRKARLKQNLAVAPADLFIAIKSDRDFRIPTIRLAEAQMRHDPAVYSYLFDWKSPTEIFGSCHSLEVGMVFGSYNNNPEFYGSGPAAEKLSYAVREAWAAFARTGNPGCKSLGDWPRFGSQRKTQILGLNCRVEEAPFDEERRAWDDIPDTYSRM